MRRPTPKTARRRRLIAFAGISAAVALLAAVLSVCRISLLPPQVAMRELQAGAGVAHIMVDPPGREGRRLGVAGFESMAKRASLLANLLSSPPVLDRIAARMGIERDDLMAEAEITEGMPSALLEPNDERRANEILHARDPYRLDIQPEPTLPLIDVYAQAPTAAEAKRLADVVAVSGNRQIRSVAERDGVAAAEEVRLRQVGPAGGGQLDPTAPAKIFALTFMVVFGACFGLLFLVAEARRGWLRAGRPPAPGSGAADPPAPAAVAEEEPGGSWPHTTRALPWMIAVFIAVLWLVPFNDIQMQASGPIDLKLDRLVLPGIVLCWLFMLGVGGRGAPRWRFTSIHAAILVFVAVAGLSVVFNAVQLNELLELGLSVKKLALLVAYLSLFLVVASVVRRSEVRPFLNLILALAVVCALGVIIEFRFDLNLFYTWSEKLLPSVFQFTGSSADGVDEIGRKLVVGPTQHSLEVVSMLAMALPIPIVGLMQSARWRERLVYGFAICVMVGAMLSTYRKSAMLAPISTCLVLAYFRRRELLKLAPFGLVLLVAVPVLSPDALGSVLDQLEPNRLGVSTVSDRVSDYDAVRPDILSHPVLGRGYGSYDHTSYRILDNDLLMRLVESGIVGLVAFVLMVLAIIAAAAPIIRSRDPARAPPALAIAAGAAPFLVLSDLFDIMAFPHAPYILFTLAGLLAVIVGVEQRRPARAGRRAAAPPRPGDPDLEPEAARSYPVPV